MNKRMIRALVAGALAALVLPAGAPAHGKHGNPGNHGKRSMVSCHALERGKARHNLSDDQVKALLAACQERDAALKAAAEQFRSATQGPRDTYRAEVKAALESVRASKQAKRDACKADHDSQACQDAKAKSKADKRAAKERIRAARKAYIAAVKPEWEKYKDAVRAAQQAFRTKVAEILGTETKTKQA